MPQYTRIWWACGNFIILINKLYAKSRDPTSEHNQVPKILIAYGVLTTDDKCK